MSSPATPPGTGLEIARVERSVRIGAPADEVWRSLTDPDELSAWLGGEVELDRPLSPGAAGRVVEGDGTVRHLLVTDHEPGRLVRWHWWHDEGDQILESGSGGAGDGELSSVEITLAPDGDATIVRVVEVVARTGARACAGPSFSAPDDELLAMDRLWAGALAVLATRLTGRRCATASR
ncbi:MAG TPA: SRPBCC domain-containing protein [Acidimicrobiales bacterium]|nr:SRPBCC domain-containing protein [Acidimicrobiales bacterium]